MTVRLVCLCVLPRRAWSSRRQAQRSVEPASRRVLAQLGLGNIEVIVLMEYIEKAQGIVPFIVILG